MNQERYTLAEQFINQRTLLSRDDLVASAARVLDLKRWAAAQPQPALDVVGSAEHRAIADDIAVRSVTLVRDDAGLLPLRLAPDARVAVLTPRPANLTPADTSSYVECTLAAEMRRFHPQVDERVFDQELDGGAIDELRAWVANYDTIVIGTINAASGSPQAALVNALLASGRPVVTVALRVPYDLCAYPAAPTYACAYSILPPSMAALARALFGRAPFAGRLPVSLPGLYPLGHGIA